MLIARGSRFLIKDYDHFHQLHNLLLQASFSYVLDVFSWFLSIECFNDMPMVERFGVGYS